MTDKLAKIRSVAESGDTTQAAQMLRWVLHHEPSADAWVLAAELAPDPAQKIKYLRRALELDSWHGAANRLLHKLEGGAPQDMKPEVVLAKEEWARATGLKTPDALKRPTRSDRFKEHAERQRFWTRLGCLSGIVFSMTLTIFAFRVIGFINAGELRKLGGIFGNPTPVTVIEGTPLAEVKNAPLIMTPSHVEQATSQDMEILDDGYMHTHYFEARQSEEFAIYVQFLSLNANHVSRNVAIVDPTGKDATRSCIPGQILEGDNNVTLMCTTPIAGRWEVRVVGRDKESVGAYFVGVESMSLR